MFLITGEKLPFKGRILKVLSLLFRNLRRLPPRNSTLSGTSLMILNRLLSAAQAIPGRTDLKYTLLQGSRFCSGINFWKWESSLVAWDAVTPSDLKPPYLFTVMNSGMIYAR